MPTLFSQKILKEYISKFHQLIGVLKVHLDRMKHWDWKVIIICVTTAFTFWIFNALNGNHTTNISLPLKISHNEENVVTLAKPPKDLTVNVSGNGWNLFKRSLSLGSDPLVVSFNKSLIFDMNYLLTKDFLPQIAEKLRDIQVNYILEDSIYFNYDTLARKEVAIAVRPDSISLSTNYRIVSDIEVVPSHLTLTGASSLLANYADTFFLNIKERSISADFSKEVDVEYPRHRLVSIEQEKVQVSFMVTKFERRSITVVPELSFTPEEVALKILPAQAQVSYLIEADEHYMPQDTLKVILDYREINFEDSTACPRLIYPDYFFEVNVTPKEFTITLEN